MPGKPEPMTTDPAPATGTLTWRTLWDETSLVTGRPQARWLCEEASGAFGPEFLEVVAQPATERCVAHLDSMLARVRQGEPLQYVLGHWSFRRLDLLVDQRVLIPRPETELVVEVALGCARQAALDHADRPLQLAGQALAQGGRGNAHRGECGLVTGPLGVDVAERHLVAEEVEQALDFEIEPRRSGQDQVSERRHQAVEEHRRVAVDQKPAVDRHGERRCVVQLEQVEPTGETWGELVEHDGRPRLREQAAPVLALVRRGIVDGPPLQAFLTALAAPLAEPWSSQFDPKLYAAQRNARNLLYTLMVALTLSPADDPHIAAAAQQVRATLGA